MKKKLNTLLLPFLILALLANHICFANINDTIPPRHKVTLPQAHIGNLEIDTKLLDSYILLPDGKRDFYLDARKVFSENANANFTDKNILDAAIKHYLRLMGGPMLGNLSDDGVVVWLRPSTNDPLHIKVTKPGEDMEEIFNRNTIEPGVAQHVYLYGLAPETQYNYTVYSQEHKLANGSFTTAPSPEHPGNFRVCFGSCFHKIGLHNPNLIHQILERNPHAMMLLGDIAVDDRENQINMHRADYLLRDLSQAWSDLAANVPLYAAWDDHDYFNNDLSGIPLGFTELDRDAVRAVWRENWNNPDYKKDGNYFSTQVGPVEFIMLDTRSCRDNQKRGELDSYLGHEQLKWLKHTLKKSEAPFKIISSGTMWSDYMSKAKDSWGRWDTEAREEIFSFIEDERIPGVLLISGDRHGARGFTIPREKGFKFYEFEAATLGGVPGPDAMAPDTSNQLYGYHGRDFVAFGEFTFDTTTNEPKVTFRLIDEFGNILEEHVLHYETLKPPMR